jgi:hypothetical protein
LVVDDLGVAREFDHAAVVRLADDVAAGAQVERTQHVHHGDALVGAHLDHGAQLFVEQRAQGQLVAALATWPAQFLASPWSARARLPSSGCRG